MVNGPKQPLLLLGGAERADLIVDFRNVPAGSTLILYNDAPAPFPRGDGRYDYYPKNPKTPTSIPGFGPNTRTLLQIRVKARVGPADPPITLPAALTPTDPFLVAQTPGVPTPNPAGVTVRYLTLNEAFDAFGRLIQLLGTDQPVKRALRHRYSVARTRTPHRGHSRAGPRRSGRSSTSPPTRIPSTSTW